MRFPIIAALLAIAGATNAADQAPPAQKPCSDPESHQFDFWIGDWDVFVPGGKQAGTNRIAPLYGCVLHESWKAMKVVEGQSFNRYDTDRGVWHQTWVDNGGSLLLLEGGLRDGAMVLSDEGVPGRSAGAPINRVTWSRNDDGSVRQHWQASKDGGKTWTTAFDGKYVRSSRPQPG
ncbi:MAG: hypothetical protein ABIQ72_12775 [Usitatibacter sp.]